jgi:hypothetical protein
LNTQSAKPEKLAIELAGSDFLAGLLIVAGAGAWGAADAVVASLMDETEPGRSFLPAAMCERLNCSSRGPG